VNDSHGIKESGWLFLLFLESSDDARQNAYASFQVAFQFTMLVVGRHFRFNANSGAAAHQNRFGEGYLIPAERFDLQVCASSVMLESTSGLEGASRRDLRDLSKRGQRVYE
jgi:hypothetical protein